MLISLSKVSNVCYIAKNRTMSRSATVSRDDKEARLKKYPWSDSTSSVTLFVGANAKYTGILRNSVI